MDSEEKMKQNKFEQYTPGKIADIINKARKKGKDIGTDLSAHLGEVITRSEAECLSAYYGRHLQPDNYAA